MLHQSKETKLRTYLGLSTFILSVALTGCGGGGSSGGSSPTTPTPVDPTPEATTDVTLKTPVEMRNIQLKVYDNTNNAILVDTSIASLNSFNVKIPTAKLNRLYRVEITTQSSSQVFDPITPQYQTLSGIYHAFITPNSVSGRIQFISPSSEAVYQRAVIRSGQLPQETVDPTRIEQLHVDLASQDVYKSLMNAFKDGDIPSLSPANSLLNLTLLRYSTTKPSTYVDSYLSFGYLQYWSTIHGGANTYQELVKSLVTDLKDGFLDGKKLHGDQTSFTPIFTPAPDNIDPLKNTLLDIAANQKVTRDYFGTNLKASTLQLAQANSQQSLDQTGYELLQKKQYTGIVPTVNSTTFIRIDGAGDYRRAVGFTTTATCNGSTYPCKQGLTSINLSDPNLPATDYLVGHYEDTSTGCQLNFRANGQIDLSKGSQIYRAALSADSTDNLLQTDAASSSYLLNSSSAEPNNSTQQYNFIQLSIKANKIISAKAGLDSRKAPDSLQTPQLECSFS
ncbi:hypothetical protein SAMN02799632_01688 [Acinetobacter pittii]|uniref:hypothetical protein n=1 Tax=Acinetobacter TaxID=469 RepID=UPI00044561D6|nr:MULTISPECIES: hypothetical protein [Acinetobacter]EXE90742.1 hypothetical protein J588_2309 [Acinetobacter sp. 1578804]EXR42162.1 hypothetical protein J655_2092 [Acinetobacter sp. 1294243]KCX16303.1 hypothetical protein J723_1571 [Acinetobacter sp. 1264765]KQE20371.1 hypothetical protein APD38_18650 [Acinetobacter pittii]KQE22034.1 hypothetical protein APD39_16785 [Acinetobacter pittii]